MPLPCSDCEQVDPIEDQGHLIVTANNTKLAYDYSNKDELLQILDRIRQTFTDPEEEVWLTVFSADHGDKRQKPIPLKQFQARLERHDLVSIIRQRAFTSYLQPILETRQLKVYGYEFLLRPLPDGPPFKPKELFEAAMATGLHSFLDRQARISSIQTAASVKLPDGIKRFINFLPSSIYNPNYCLSHTFEAAQMYKQSPDDLVFEVVETEKITSIPHLQSIFDVYRKHGMRVALDDVGSGFSTIDVVEQLKPDYVKIDRNLIDHCETNREKQESIAKLVSLAADIGGLTLAEGMERREEWTCCRELGVDLVQGYLFGKPMEKPS